MMNLSIGVLLTLGVFGLFIVAMAISKPDLGLSALIIVVYTNLSDVLIQNYGLPSTTQPLIGLLLLVILIRRFMYREEYEGWSQLTVLLGIYMFLGYLSIFYAMDSDLVTETLLYYVKNAVIGLIVIFLIQKESSLKWAIWSLLAAGIFMGTISTYQVMTGTFNNSYWGFGKSIDNTVQGFRLWGSIGDSNFYAQIMLALVPIAVERFMHEKKQILRLLAGWGAFVCVLTVYYTFSRGGFLALLVVIMLIFLRQPSKPYVGLVMFAVLALVAYQFLPAQYTARITSLFQLIPGVNVSAKKDASLTGRASANIIGWNMFSDHPVLGVGVGNYNANFTYYARELGLSHEAGAAHNLYLEIAAERGILGLLAFSAIIYSTFRVLSNTKRMALNKNFKEFAAICDALSTGLTGYLVAATFLHDAHIRYFWILLGIAWSVPQVLNSLSGHSYKQESLRSLRAIYND